MSSQFAIGAIVRWSPDGQHMKNVSTKSPTEAQAKEGLTIEDMPTYGEGPFTVKDVTTLGNGQPGVLLEEIDRPGFVAYFFELVPDEVEVPDQIAAE